MNNAPDKTLHKTDDELAAFKADLYTQLKAALQIPTPASIEVQRMLQNLNAASTALHDASIQEVRSALESIQQQEQSKRSFELAEVMCDVAGSLGIAIKPVSISKSGGSSASRTRYTPDQRQKIAQQLFETLRAIGSGGLAKAELAKQLSLTPNQIKRILQWPEVQNDIVTIGASRNRRYALKNVSQPTRQISKETHDVIQKTADASA